MFSSQSPPALECVSDAVLQLLRYPRLVTAPALNLRPPWAALVFNTYLGRRLKKGAGRNANIFLEVKWDTGNISLWATGHDVKVVYKARVPCVRH